MYLMRTKAMHEAYQAYRESGGLDGGCRLCEAPTLRDFTHWRIIPNKFPYDHIATAHDMLIPKRHVTEDKLTDEEKAELYGIKSEKLEADYVFIMEPLPHQKSIPAHFHLHLIVPKEEI